VTAMTTDTTVATARPPWRTHPVQAWRAHLAALAARADAQARAAGLTVEVLPGGMRRYRDPRLDHLAEHRARHTGSAAQSTGWSPTQLIPGALVDGWGESVCGASCRAHALDVPVLPAGPAAPAPGMTDRLRRAEPLAVAGAVPDPPPPHQAGCARSFPSGSAEKRYAGNHLAVRRDPGDPAGPVPGALRAGAEDHAPARPATGPWNAR
jgi:hypothetical protein